MPDHHRPEGGEDVIRLAGAVLILDAIEQDIDVGAADLGEGTICPDGVDVFRKLTLDFALGSQPGLRTWRLSQSSATSLKDPVLPLAR